MPYSQGSLRGPGPIVTIHGFERHVDREPTGAAEVVSISNHRALRPGLAGHIGIARVQACDPRSLISRSKRRDQMILQTHVVDVAPKRRPIFFANDENHIGIVSRNRVLSAPFDKVLPVEDPVVLVGDLDIEQIHVLRPAHHHHVFQGIA